MPASLSGLRRTGWAIGAGLLALILTACGNQGSQVQANEPSVVNSNPGAALADSPTGPAPSMPAPVDCTVAKCIAFTFDDGPSEYTPKLLDTFVAQQSRATLFLLGKSASLHPDTVRRAHELGFEIGNHTTDHKMLNQVSAAEVEHQLSDTQQRIQQITGVFPSLLRPPYGARNKTSDAISGKLGLSVVVWADSPSDWVNKSEEIIIKLTLERARPGIIMLFHDTKKWTVNAMSTIVPKLKEQGYSLVTVSQLLGKPEPGKLYS